LGSKKFGCGCGVAGVANFGFSDNYFYFFLIFSIWRGRGLATPATPKPI